MLKQEISSYLNEIGGIMADSKDDGDEMFVCWTFKYKYTLEQSAITHTNMVMRILIIRVFLGLSHFVPLRLNNDYWWFLNIFLNGQMVKAGMYLLIWQRIWLTCEFYHWSVIIAILMEFLSKDMKLSGSTLQESSLLSIKDIVRDSQTQKCDSSLLAQLREQILFEVFIYCRIPCERAFCLRE